MMPFLMVFYKKKCLCHNLKALLMKKHPEYVCRLHKALYKLKQALQA